jgi:hypothetical protein
MSRLEFFDRSPGFVAVTGTDRRSFRCTSIRMRRGVLVRIPNRRANMTTRIGLGGVASIIAVGAFLTAPAFAQDDLTGHHHARAFDQERIHASFPSGAGIYQQRAQTSRQCSDSPARC